MLATLEWRKDLVKKSKREALKARMNPDVYDKYIAETKEIGKVFQKSVEQEEWKEVQWKGGNDNIPSSFYNQNDYEDLIFDYRGCYHLNGAKKPDDYLTMKDGGTIPCALLSILEYYHIHETLEELGGVLVENGYRTKADGVLWSALDIVPEIEYGIESKIAGTIKQIAEAIENKKPVLILAPATWLQRKQGVQTNQAAVIWGIEGKNFLYSTTKTALLECRRIEEVLKHTKRAWIFG